MAAGVRLAIVGGRDWHDYETLVRTIDSAFPVLSCIISGGATGADALAKRYATDKSIDYIEYTAEWHLYGKAAGPMRNKLIVDDCTHMFAFWDGKSPGTASSIRLARSAGRQLTVIRYD